MSYAFRIRFRPGKSVHIASDEKELVCASAAEHGEDVILRSPLDNTTFNDARDLALIGKGYDSQEQAAQAGERWLGVLLKAFARKRLGVDFGDRAAGSVVFEEALEQFGDGLRVVNDVHGLMVFEAEPWPMFFGAEGTATTGRTGDTVLEAVSAAAELGLAASARERLAYNLYGASFSEETVDARFTMLMMALETLIETEPRAADVIAHVDRLIAETEASAIPKAEIASILGTLRYLRNESINQAGRRLALSLGDRKYMEEDAVKFFSRSYKLRSDLVHGAVPRPPISDIGDRLSPLEKFVGDLLSLELLDVVDD